MEFLQATAERLASIWDQATAIWLNGGLAMVAIAVIALAMFGMGTHVHFSLRRTGFLSVPEKAWRRWLDHPRERRGPIGRLLDAVAGARTVDEIAGQFEHVRANEAAPFERDLRVMKVCVSAAPLVGLLGTVTGMLATFAALSSGAGGEKTMSQVAKGISEALITTETGLVIALPGVFFHYQLVRKFESYKAFLAHLQTVCTQKVYQRQREDVKHRARRTARAQIAQELHRRLGNGRIARPSVPAAAPQPRETVAH